MKIRIKGNSIRLRLSRTEVEKLATEGLIDETTEFNDGVFGYSLQTKEGIDHLTASYRDNVMTVYMPVNYVGGWATNETVGFEYNLNLTNGNSLFLLVEKDFKCIDAAVTEDQSDNYENPLLSCE